MPQYMLQASYTAEALAALTKSPEDRTEGLRALAKKMGGKLVSLHFTMGDTDVVVVIEAPDDTAATAIALAAIAPGHLKSTRTTRLYTAAEMLTALKKAQGAGYKAPKG
jgi:uncharacterized protein with GYD domain